MVDLETLGGSVGAAIVSVGACVFDMNGVHATFYQVVNNPEGRLDADTVLWWMKQPDEVRKTLYEKGTYHNDHYQIMWGFADFWKCQGGKHFWARASHFDAPILRHAMLEAGIRVDFKDWWVRDTITTFENLGFKNEKLPEGKAHHALNDAMHEAGQVIKCYRENGRTLA
jgi:hypothetical protein